MEEKDLYFALRRFPEIAKSFRESEKFHQTGTKMSSSKKIFRADHTAETTMSFTGMKMKDLTYLKQEELNTLDQSWSAVRESRKQKRCKTPTITKDSSEDHIPYVPTSPLESSLWKLKQSGFPGIEKVSQSYTLDPNGLIAVLGIHGRITTMNLRSQLLNILGVALTEEEATSFCALLTERSGMD
jgi:hypothetical protein